MSTPYSEPYEPFADVCRRLDLVPRLIAVQERIEDGDSEGAVQVVGDLEYEVAQAIKQNELSEQTWATA